MPFVGIIMAGIGVFVATIAFGLVKVSRGLRRKAVKEAFQNEVKSREQKKDHSAAALVASHP